MYVANKFPFRRFLNEVFLFPLFFAKYSRSQHRWINTSHLPIHPLKFTLSFEKYFHSNPFWRLFFDTLPSITWELYQLLLWEI